MSLANTALRTVRRRGVPRRRALVVLLAALALCPFLFMAVMAECVSDSDGDFGPGGVPLGGQIHLLEDAFEAGSGGAVQGVMAETTGEAGAASARVMGVCDECSPASMFPVGVEVPLQRVAIHGLTLPAAGAETSGLVAGLAGLLWAFCRHRLRSARGEPPQRLLVCVSRT